MPSFTACVTKNGVRCMQREKAQVCRCEGALTSYLLFVLFNNSRIINQWFGRHVIYWGFCLSPNKDSKRKLKQNQYLQSSLHMAQKTCIRKASSHIEGLTLCIQSETYLLQLNCQYGHFWAKNKNNLQCIRKFIS